MCYENHWDPDYASSIIDSARFESLVKDELLTMMGRCVTIIGICKQSLHYKPFVALVDTKA